MKRFLIVIVVLISGLGGAALGSAYEATFYMHDPTFRISYDDGKNYFHPNETYIKKQFWDAFRAGWIPGLGCVPIVGIWAWVARKYGLDSKSLFPASLVCAVGGGVYGLLASFLLYAIEGGWGPPFLPALTISGLLLGVLAPVTVSSIKNAKPTG